MYLYVFLTNHVGGHGSSKVENLTEFRIVPISVIMHVYALSPFLSIIFFLFLALPILLLYS